ncbi:MAG: NAD(P)-dependent glycerol-3-phosphate dehydrogenase [Magnetococcales bacterium]|nr:NAD(P)-dependent glycerol-3-phosphate dehydrogenase [Magnetococcales bacterium]
MHDLESMPDVAVIGAGSWGTALASVLADRLPRVTLWCRETEVATGINRNRHNPLFQSEFLLPANIEASTDLIATAARNSILIMVAPTQFTRAVLNAIREFVTPATLFVSASKGVEADSMTLLSDLYVQVFGEEVRSRCCFLSGPSFARDVLSRLPAAVAVAGSDPANVERVRELFHTGYFRTYSSDDVVGLELGGALKNVYALAAGICDGLGLGHSARAALLTRGLSEMIRLGVVMGARVETFAGLSGMGDLLLTATSTLSRNHTVGRRLGAGESLEEIQSDSREIAEGVMTVQGVVRLAAERGIDMPIAVAVHDILHAGLAPLDAVRGLMEREPKPETFPGDR